MNKTPYQTKIPISQLLIDIQNPRLPEMPSNQDNAIREMIRTQGNKVLALAHHLAHNGTNPANLPIVIPAPEDYPSYYVLDGNRRLTALRLLGNPQFAVGLIDNQTSKKLQELSLQYKHRPISELECVIFSNREQADPWIQLIHRGESQGAGLVEWNGQVAARYDERRGIGDRGAPVALQILDLVKEHETLSHTTREKIAGGKFPITSLTRLINTPYVRKKIGLRIKDHTIESFEGKTIRSLAQIVEDFGTEYKTVSDIKRLRQRIEYIDQLFEPHPTEPEKSEDGTAAGTPSTSPTPSDKRKKAGKEDKPRINLIPKEFLADVTQSRINKIFVELKKLNADEFPNACAVMYRVFLELSLDYYLEDTIKWSEQQIQNSTLAQKLTAVANYMGDNKIMSAIQLAPIRKAAGGQTLLAASVRTLHSYVHNKYFSPIPSELKTAWDDTSIFISNVWPL